MEKVFLAIGHRKFEEALKKKASQFNFVGETVYKEGIIKGVESNNPDILIIRETLSGQTPIMDIIYELRCNYPHVRIIFVAKNERKPGDALLASLVGYGIYDILSGETTNITDIVKLLEKANKISDVMYLKPKVKLDEDTNNILFEAPESKKEKVEVIRYIDNTKVVEEDSKESDIKLSDLNTDLSFEKIQEDVPKKSDESLEINELEELSLEKIAVNNNNIDENKIKEKAISEAKKEAEIKILEAKEKAKKAEKEALAKIKAKEKEAKKAEKDREKILAKLNELEKSAMQSAQSPVSGKQKIISFVGAKHGCGNTQIAFNTALDLALNGKKVIFLEISNHISTIGYTYQIYNIENGIDTALKGISNNKYEEVDKSIINLGKLVDNIDKTHVLYNSYKKLPKTLDVMFVSESYIQENNYLNPKDFYKEKIKELYLYLMYQKSYDYLIIDISGDVNEDLLYTSVIYSNKAIFTITQDVNVISSSIYQINMMNKKRINLREKIYYILNRFDSKAKLGINDIEEWLGEKIECNIISVLEDYNRLFIDSAYMGLPILLNSPNRNIRQAFTRIANKINE